MSRNKTTATMAAAAALIALTGAQGGCGSSSGNQSKPTSGYTTRVAVDGQPGAAHTCTMRLTLLAPQYQQLTANLTVTCSAGLASATTSLVIQGRPLGGNETHWDNLSDPRVSEATSSISLTYSVPCITSLEYQASAAIDVTFADGAVRHDTDTAGPKSYGPSECSSGK